MKKTLILLALAIAFSVGNCPGCVDCRAYAADSTAATPATGTTEESIATIATPFTFGEDNFICSRFKGKSFFVVGGSVALLGYTKPLSSTDGNSLDLTLNLGAGSAVSGDYTGETAITGAISIDLIKLITGVKGVSIKETNLAAKWLMGGIYNTYDSKLYAATGINLSW
jgi:hypothetical protein